MTVITPICSYCTRFNTEVRDREICQAFPDGIPTDILEGRNDHKVALKDEVTFEPIAGFEYWLGEGLTTAGDVQETPLHAVATSHEPSYRVALQAAFKLAQRELRKALGDKPSYNLDSTLAVLKKALGQTLPSLVRRTLVAGGQVTQLRTAKLRTAKRSGKPKIDFSFDAKNQSAIDWADRHAAELIDGIAETSRTQINNAIADALETGDFESALDDILAAVGDPARAELIARNETMTAVSEGQRQAWDQAVEDGYLTGDEVRTWIVVGDEKVCPICDGLDGAQAKLGEAYVGDDGEEYDGPPAHVSCRCTEGISG